MLTVIVQQNILDIISIIHVYRSGYPRVPFEGIIMARKRLGVANDSAFGFRNEMRWNLETMQMDWSHLFQISTSFLRDAPSPSAS